MGLEKGWVTDGLIRMELRGVLAENRGRRVDQKLMKKGGYGKGHLIYTVFKGFAERPFETVRASLRTC